MRVIEKYMYMKRIHIIDTIKSFCFCFFSPSSVHKHYYRIAYWIHVFYGLLISWCRGRGGGGGGAELASIHPEINLSVWKCKDNERLGILKRISTIVKPSYQSSIQSWLCGKHQWTTGSLGLWHQYMYNEWISQLSKRRLNNCVHVQSLLVIFSTDSQSSAKTVQ